MSHCPLHATHTQTSPDPVYDTNNAVGSFAHHAFDAARDAIAHLKAANNKAAPTSLAQLFSHDVTVSQAAMDAETHEANHARERMRLENDLPARAQLLSASGPHAGAHLAASPAIPALRLPDPQYAAALVLHLGLPQPRVPSKPGPCQLCGDAQDATGQHAFVCRNPTLRADTTRRHTGVKRALHQSGTNAPEVRTSLAAHLERPVSDIAQPLAHGNGLIADILVVGDTRGTLSPHAVDVVVTTPNTNKGGNDAVVGGCAVARAEEAKRDKYKAAHGLTGDSFRPFGLETYGTWGAGANAYAKALADYAFPNVRTYTDVHNKLVYADYDGCRNKFIRRLREHVAVALQRGNALCILRWRTSCVAPAPVGAGAAAVAPAGLAA